MRRLILQVLMRSFVLTAFLSILSGSSLFAVETGIFESTRYDFKGIPRYTKPRHSFVFTNQSEDVLRLVDARTSCQCTKVYVPEKREYAKGEKGEVVAEIDAVRYTGARHATLTLTFERSGQVFEVPLNVVGMVVENVKLTPSHLDFIVDELNDDSTTSAKSSQKSRLEAVSRSQVVLVQYGSANETVVKATSSSPYVEVKIGKPSKGKNGSSIPLTVSIADDAPAGYINSTVSVWSNGASRATPLTFDVSGVVQAPLLISPPTLTFFTSPNGEKITKNIVVSASSPFTLKEVVSDSDSINVKISPKSIRSSKVCVVPVSFDPSKLRDGTGLAHLQVKTTDGRVLSLCAQISSGNFEANGLVQLDEPTTEFNESFAEDEKTVSKSDSDAGFVQIAPPEKSEIKTTEAPVKIVESKTNSSFRASKNTASSKYSSADGYVPRDEYRPEGSSQSSTKTSRLPSNPLLLR